MTKPALIYSPAFAKHDPGLIKVEGNNLYHLVAGQKLLDPVYTLDKIQYPYPYENPTYHPEAPFRSQTTFKALQDAGLTQLFSLLEPEPATKADLLRAHTPEYIAKVRTVSEKGGFLAEATYLNSASYETALLSAGAALTASRAVLSGDFSYALSLGRPPGHHAGRERAGGFCLFNNAAIAAKYCLEVNGCERVLIIDWDLHHGDGIQDIVQHDPRITFCSLHQFGPELYPESGPMDDNGLFGNIINLPLPAKIGDADYLAIFERVVPALVRQVLPDIIIVAAGFDGHSQDINQLYLYDPGAGFHLTAQIYHSLTNIVAEAAAEVASPYLVLLEGGYAEMNLGMCVANVAAAMVGLPPKFIYELSPDVDLLTSFDTAGYVSQLNKTHRGRWAF